jgi:hypothetical protein
MEIAAEGDGTDAAVGSPLWGTSATTEDKAAGNETWWGIGPSSLVLRNFFNTGSSEVTRKLDLQPCNNSPNTITAASRRFSEAVNIINQLK